MGEVIWAFPGGWLTKKQLAKELGVSVSFLEKRIREGMPSRMMAGKRQMQLRACEDWLRSEGYLVEDSSA